jgi:hypothetical protein
MPKRKKKIPGPAPKKGHDECAVPPALPKRELHKLLFKYDETEARRISDYVEWQAHGKEKVLHAEQVASERVFGRQYDVWDVHTECERWWVVTNPTNLHSQTLMPSLDYTLSFHIGVMARVEAQRKPEGGEAEQEFLLVTNRKFVQAAEAFDHADETEEFQAVGMRCRECLLTLVRELIAGGKLESSNDPPKAGDFSGWNERIADFIAPGGSAEHVRGYLKTTGERAWRLANWLTHCTSATRGDAELALNATSHVINNYVLAVLRDKAGAPSRCERCKSYKITIDWRPDLGPSGLYVPRCETCGTVKLPSNARSKRGKTNTAEPRPATQRS